MDERVDSVENRVHATELAHTTLKARVDFIVESLNTLQDIVERHNIVQDIHNASKELF
jgi:argonaute-like protein implicated in RNA metabolism and viral defense